MDTPQIDEILQDLPLFAGTYPRDAIPSLPQRPIAFIVNTDSKHEQGEHWVAFILTKRKTCIYFDPFGFPPLHSDFINYFQKEAPSGLFYSSMTTQNAYSDLCGNYCIHFIRKLLSGCSLLKFLKTFTSDTLQNDQIIKNYKKVSYI